MDDILASIRKIISKPRVRHGKQSGDTTPPESGSDPIPLKVEQSLDDHAVPSQLDSNIERSDEANNIFQPPPDADIMQRDPPSLDHEAGDDGFSAARRFVKPPPRRATPIDPPAEMAAHDGQAYGEQNDNSQAYGEQNYGDQAAHDTDELIDDRTALPESDFAPQATSPAVEPIPESQHDIDETDFDPRSQESLHPAAMSEESDMAAPAAAMQYDDGGHAFDREMSSRLNPSHEVTDSYSSPERFFPAANVDDSTGNFMGIEYPPPPPPSSELEPMTTDTNPDPRYDSESRAARRREYEQTSADYQPVRQPPIADPSASHFSNPANVDPSDIISDDSRDIASRAFDVLQQPVVENEEARILRDIAIEAMQPILREWLNEHLPKIVERLVAEEVEKLSRRR